MTSPRKKPATLVQLLGIARRWAEAQGFMTEAEYRSRLAGMFNGRTSASDLTLSEQQHALTTLFEHGLGWQRTGKGGAPAPSTGRRKLERSPASTKIRALWLHLHVLGEVRDSSERALAHYARRQVGVEDLHWATPQQKSDLIETLKFWAVRPMRDAVAAMLADVASQDTPDLRAARHLAERAANSKSWAPWWQAWCAARIATTGAIDPGIAIPLGAKIPAGT